VQAAEVMATMLDRAGHPPGGGEVEQALVRADGSDVPLNLSSRPSLSSLGLSRDVVG
jgi:hypothetical protein